MKNMVMKNARLFLTIIISSFAAFPVVGQEFDDMYFNSKDRAKLNEGKITADLGGLAKKTSAVNETNLPINPTDSYSARNINPEYAAQLNAESGATNEYDYFPQDFQPTGVNQSLSNCNCSNGSFYSPYNNPYNGFNSFNNYGYNNGFGNPYNSYYNSPWGYPSYGGFGSGLSMSMGYGWGGFSPGFYGGAGYGSGFGNYFNPYNQWGGGYFGNYYPQQLVIINNSDAGTRVSYSKRSSRSSNTNHIVDSSRPNSNQTIAGTGRSSISSGRSRSETPEYYDRSWKRNQNASTTRGYWNNPSSGNSAPTRSTFNNGNTNSGGRQGFSNFATPTRNSFNSGGTNSGGSRSSGSSGGSRSSGSSTRGRSN